jgi:hypothetical protein
MLPVRLSKVFVAMSVLLLCSIAFVSPDATAGAAIAPQAASTGPQCTFNGSALPLVTGVSAGSKIAISCKGLPPLHPYLFVGTSLLLGIDPSAAPLLSGQIASLPGLLALLSALPEIDLASEALPISDLSGNLNLTWTVPTFQPLDPNASCPPTQQEVNSGLIGCAVAMIDLTSFRPVAAGSGVFEYSGFSFLPPNPTLALSTSRAMPNQTVSVSDAPGATTYWWLSTLAALEAALGGASSPPTVTVTLVDPHGNVVPVPSNIHVAPATYNGSTFSPPIISGGFSIPPTMAGPETVNVQVGGTLDGLPLSNSASAPLFINNPPTTSVVIPSNGATLSGWTLLDASASNATSVEFQLFGGVYGFYGPIICTATPTYFGYLCNWNTTNVPNGTYVLSSVASNSAGTTLSSGVDVTVSNPPTTSVVIPSNGATQSGTAALLDASASANVTSVKFELTGGTLTDKVIATATPTYYGWLAQWNTTTVPNGTYALQSMAAYPGGVTGTSSGVTVTVANPGLVDLANSAFTATSTASPGGGCGIAHLNFDAVYPGSAAVGNVTLHIAGCVSDPVTYVGTFTITTGVGTLSGSAPGTVTEQEVGVDLEQSYQINLSVTTATGSFSGTTGTLLFSAPLNGVDSVAVE